jgi:transcriptional regulator
MYKLPYFTETDNENIIAFIRENPFAIVTGFGDTYPVASHLPLQLSIKEDGKMFFSGHLMKNTDHHKAFEKNEHVLLIFNGPHSYVSASWYTEKNVASTWNYMTVHAKGKIRFTDEEGTYNAIKAITDQYEGADSPASFENLSASYVNRLIKAIVGFEIEVTEMDNVFKLSQNHTPETRKSIVTHLSEASDPQAKKIATEVDKRID